MFEEGFDDVVEALEYCVLVDASETCEKIDDCAELVELRRLERVAIDDLSGCESQ